MRGGVVYYAVGPEYAKMAVHSARSLKKRMPGVPITIFTDSVIRVGINGVSVKGARFREPRRLEKIVAMEMAPHFENLYLDADTFVCGDLSSIFKLLDRFDIAVAHAPQRFCCTIEGIPDSFPEYDTGVMAYRKTPQVLDLLKRWKQELAFSIEAVPSLKMDGIHRDQPAFRAALWANTQVRIATLPQEFNCRPEFGAVWDRVKIVHSKERPGTFGWELNRIPFRPRTFRKGRVWH